MGSIGAMKARGVLARTATSRATSSDVEKLVPEGIEGRVPYKGPLADVRLPARRRPAPAMGYCGAPTIEDAADAARFVRITGAGLRESHPHDITITKEAPNYRRSLRLSRSIPSRLPEERPVLVAIR